MATHKCAVPGCGEEACVEVRLYDLYIGRGYEPEVFNERDYTCPYLCEQHLLENEEKAEGERKARGYVKYPYSNQMSALGFTIYRDLNPREV
jgi:hypothetical protein